MNNKRLIILGNGFDLNLGLKSSFNNFIDNNFTQAKNMIEYISKQNNIDYFYFFRLILDEVFDTKVENRSDNKLLKILQNYDTKNQKFNFWIYYLLFIRYTPSISTPTNNWCDIESIMYNFMSDNYLKEENNFEDFFNLTKYYNISNNVYQPTTKINNVNDSNRQQFKIDGCKNCINIFLISLMMKTDNKFKEIFKECFDNDIRDNYYNIKMKHCLFNYLIQQLHDFEDDFNEHLNKEIKKISYVQKSNYLISRLSENKNYSLLNFNYTVPVSNSNIYQCNIHGNTNDSDIIIGINDENVSMYRLSYQFTKTFRIAASNTANNYNDVISDVNEIVFFGHSLGLADYSYFRNIFNDINLTGNNKIKLIFVYATHGNTDDTKAKRNQLLNISKLINKYINNEGINIKGNNFLSDLILRGKIKLKNINQL